MRQTIACILLLTNMFFLSAQDKKTDSLLKLIQKEKQDTTKFNLYADLVIAYERNSNPRDVKTACDSLFSIARHTKLVFEEARSYHYYAGYYSLIGDYYTSVQYYYKAIKIYETLNYQFGLCSSYLNMGNVFFYTHDINKAYELYKKSLMIYKKNNFKDKSTLANLYNNLGSSAASLYQFDLAKNYFVNALQCFVDQKDSISMAFSFNNIGLIYKELGQNDSAHFYLKNALKLKLKFGNKSEKIDGYNELGTYFYDIGDIKNALINFQGGVELIDTTHVDDKDILILKNISEAFKKINNKDKAYYYLDLCYRFNDDLHQSNQKATLDQLEGDFAIAKKQYADSLLSVSKNQIQQLKIIQQGEQLKSEKRQRILLLFGIGIVMIGIVLFYKRYKITKKQKEIIEEQKMLVEEKNHEITYQRDLIEEKQKEVIDSINYAQRIQNAVLTSEKVWQKVSPQHFIFFQPKDIVSGDFYWAYNTPNNRSIWAVADCTGHGVPGAFMSMLGNSFLNQIVIEGKIFKASEILNKLREKIIEALEQKGVNQNDGMDISLCVWNKLNNTVEFSGANNSLVIVRQGNLIELKADKMPIGKHHSETTSFTNQEFSLQTNDTLYIYTDGYADQFGGPKGKKFRYKELDNLLVKNCNLSMKEQHSNLTETFLTWKGGLIQTDDVCIIGIKVLT